MAPIIEVTHEGLKKLEELDTIAYNPREDLLNSNEQKICPSLKKFILERPVVGGSLKMKEDGKADLSGLEHCLPE